VPARDLTSAQRAAWSELADRAASPNPVFEPDFVMAAARGLAANELHVLIVREGSEWLAALPVTKLRSWKGVPGPCLANWMHFYCFLGTPLVAGDDLEQALATLLDHGLRSSGSVVLDTIDADGPLAEPLFATVSSRARAVVLQRFERAALRRRPQPDYLQQTLSSGHRSELRRKFRRLQEAVGELTVTDRRDHPDAYDEFMELERAGWKGAEGTALACDPAHAAFFREMCERFAARGRLQLLALAGEQSTVAMMCNLIAGDVTFGFKIAFDERFGKLSPGMQLQSAQIERFHHGPCSWIDSCTDPENAEMKRVWPDRRLLLTAVAVRRHAAAALIYVQWRAVAVAANVRSRRRSRLAGA